MGPDQRIFLPAVQHFWDARSEAESRHQEKAATDQGGRQAVTSGGHLDGFLDMIKFLILDAGLAKPEELKRGRRLPVLPGYFRPEKEWDLVVLKGKQLGAALELKAQIGPSFGNNFNNRTEEALGSADDFWTAFREDAFGNQPAPWLGYLFLLEDHPKVRRPVRLQQPLFPALPEFQGASYAKRYELMLRRMVKERRYTAAAFILSENPEGRAAEFSEPVSDLAIVPWVRSLKAHLSIF